MNLGARLRKLRKERAMSQGDVEKATGMLRCYISRVECGHTVPSLGTLEKYAATFQVPLYRLFYEGDQPPLLPNPTPREHLEELAKQPGDVGSEARFFLKLRKLLAKVEARDRGVFLAILQQLVKNSTNGESIR